MGSLESVEMRKASDNSYIGKKIFIYDTVQRPLRQMDDRVDQTYITHYEEINGFRYPDDATKGVQLANKYTDLVEKDELRRPATRTLTLYGDSNAFFSETYSYISGSDGRQTGYVSRITNSLANETLRYTYDKSGNIETVSDDNGLLFKYSYDGLNRLVHEENYQQSKRYSYTYDNGGNITNRKTYQLVSGVVSELLNTDTYAYSSAWKDQLISYNGQAITYDALGNPTTYKGKMLTWTNVRRLASYGNNTFAYNANGIRYQKNNTVYTLEGNRILRESDGAKTLTYYYGANGVIGFNYNDTDYYYRKNLQGDIIAIYRADGTLVAEYEYDAWGKILSVINYNGSEVGSINPFRYRSYYYDTETGLYYLRTRYYDPEFQKFISSDNTNIALFLGMGMIGGLHLFSYCFNNPILYIDDGGFWPKPFMYRGWKIRFDPPRAGDGQQYHVHVDGYGRKYAQNIDGTTHEGLEGIPDKAVRDVIKKVTKGKWEWKTNTISYSNIPRWKEGLPLIPSKKTQESFPSITPQKYQEQFPLNDFPAESESIPIEEIPQYKERFPLEDFRLPQVDVSVSDINAILSIVLFVAVVFVFVFCFIPVIA